MGLTMFIELDSALVRLRFLPAGKSAKIAPLAGLRVLLARIQPVFTRFELTNHSVLPLSVLKGKDAARKPAGACNNKIKRV